LFLYCRGIAIHVHHNMNAPPIWLLKTPFYNGITFYHYDHKFLFLRTIGINQHHYIQEHLPCLGH
jgi:hypothetical protein